MSSTSRKNKKRKLEQQNAQRRTLGLPLVEQKQGTRGVHRSNTQITIQPYPFNDFEVFMGCYLGDIIPMKDIPAAFKTDRNPYVKLQSEWFFAGLNSAKLITREGVDRIAALRHLKAIQASFTPSHEHKQAAVAYLMSMWFDIVL